MLEARTETQSTDVAQLLAGAARTIEKVRYCWLVTTTPEGHTRARPMGRLLHDPDEDDWRIRFVTDGRSRKTADLAHDGTVSLVFQHDPSDAYVAVSGRAVLRAEESEVRRRWKNAYEAYFPTEQDRAHAAFLELDVEAMELWIRGVTPEPFGLAPTVLKRQPGGRWHLVPLLSR
ncbi:General stress protein 26 [Enhydrobacter aerosaccus]|uniref:General stress protein 26 n=1 Tax=Enhydrobacter aerosaccus TaxID=225324 RepID=A0A1T4SQP5_9HYPH|nr:pyridoxamine 5'-phosphate oxidase family protein [Enhydrobacter aerosaccus]SKA30549.1 General stress protein 26 [Enhydrobacter aerosaccus]